MVRSEGEDRAAIVAASQRLARTGLNPGTAGNISLRRGDAMLITPSGIRPEDLTADAIAAGPLRGDAHAFAGPHRPSSEWRFHQAILCARADVGAIVHTHAPHATALSILRQPIPAAHYMIAAFGGPRVHCTDYAPFGSAELSDLAVEGLGDRHAVLLGNHGMICTGDDLQRAMWRAEELETLARLYILARSVGQPVILSDAEVSEAIERFRSYGPSRTPISP